MKRIIDGKTYNTETSTKIFTYDQSQDEDVMVQSNFGLGEVFTTLYRTRHGAFFFHHVNVHLSESELQPASDKQALEWMERHCSAERIEETFGQFPEAGEGSSAVRIRLPDVLKARIERAAKANGQSLNAWVIRCLERCAGVPAAE